MERKTFDVTSTSALSVSSSWAAGTRATLSVDSTYPAEFSGNLQALYVIVSAIFGAASLTMRLTTDTAADVILIPDSTATLSTGLTTAAKGAAVWKIALDATLPDNVVYAYFKSDAGTLTVDSVKLVYQRRM